MVGCIYVIDLIKLEALLANLEAVALHLNIPRICNVRFCFAGRERLDERILGTLPGSSSGEMRRNYAKPAAREGNPLTTATMGQVRRWVYKTSDCASRLETAAIGVPVLRYDLQHN